MKKLSEILFPKLHQEIKSLREDLALARQAYEAAVSLANQAEDKAKALEGVAKQRGEEYERLRFLSSREQIEAQDRIVELEGFAGGMRRFYEQEKESRELFQASAKKWKKLFWDSNVARVLLPGMRSLRSHWEVERRRSDALYEALAELVEAFEADVRLQMTSGEQSALEIAKDLLKQPRPIRY